MDTSTLIHLIVGGLLLGAVYALAAAGLNLIFGVMRIVNFAHGDLMMLGAYTTFWLWDRYQLNPLLTLAISVPALFALGWLLQATLVHRVVGQSPLMSLILMYGVSLTIINLGLIAWTSNFRSVPYLTGSTNILGITISTSRGVAFIAAFVLSMAVWLFLRRARWGKAVRATAQSAEMALVCGINVSRVRLLTFGLAAAMAGAAGTLLVTILPVTPGIGPTFLLKAFTIIVIGGLGSFSGAFVGALVVGVLESVASYLIKPQLAEAVIYLALILFLLFRPAGLLGVRE